MQRRSFIKKGTAAFSIFSLGLGNLSAFANSFSEVPLKPHDFKLHFAPHLGMFKNHAGKDAIAQLNFIADQGFTAFEDNNMKNRSLEVQIEMAKTMEQRGLRMGVFVAHKIYWKEPSLTSGNLEKRNEFLEEIKSSVAVAKRVKAKWITVVPGCVDAKQDLNYQTAHVIESLKQASKILEPHNITMVLEPLNFLNHPNQFLTESPQAYQICKAVNSPSCKILFDIYHQQIQEGNIINNIEKCWDEIAYFQIGDNPGRKEPTTGEINYQNIFKHIYKKGYTGILGMEHGNSIAGKEGETAVLNAYKKTSAF
ncbi:hydroxypyruvate isomerase family protein [Flavicella sediminum]|uniref:hydroxypyruvate isomerase family protein n=1 Tax=Flavicella sediminum TaxID=2585141 RepID=UPI001120E379|nr:TIM barrel protein [Flavicella sediminum]